MSYKKNFSLTIIWLLFFACSTSVAHLQNVHQYIVREGYALLRNTVGDIPTMRDHVGVGQIGDRPWQTGFIVTGAWREDVEDPVYEYGNSWPPGVSGSHFWVSDNGDESDVTLRWVTFGNTDHWTGPSAYMKIRRYAYPGTYGYYHVKIFWGEVRTNGGWPCAPSMIMGIGIAYDNLIDFFKTGNGYVVGYYDYDGEYYECSAPQPVSAIGEPMRSQIVWEVLGRMAHLLGDMSVPAHAHGDAHGLCDSPPVFSAVANDTYERWVGSGVYPVLWT